MLRWHHRLNGHEFEQTPEDGRMGNPGTLQPMGLRLNNKYSPYYIIVAVVSVKSYLTLCMDFSMPGFPVLHCLLEFAQIHVH